MDPGEYFSAPARQAATLRETAHRPWALPQRSWLMGQSWLGLLFAHWRLRPETLRPLVPDGLSLDTFDGHAWLGVTPFRVTGLRLRGTPPFPVSGSFLELNVRTYVSAEEKPGILFFSLDAASAVAVAAARRFYKLPYFRARMSATEGASVDYESRRVGADPGAFAFRGSYEPVGPVFNAQPGSLEWFLAERYCLYTTGEQGELLRADIHHPPWPLQPARAEIELNTMTPRGVELPPEEPLLHFAARQDVVIWSPQPLAD